jgi:ferrochelatase
VLDDRASAGAATDRRETARTEKLGVLLVNLGTPDRADYWAVRRYLREFLSDRRVVETPRAIWLPILNLFILARRPAARARDYHEIWNRDRDESPLKTFTRAQAEGLAASIAAGAFGAAGARVEIAWGMRYGNPSIKAGIMGLQAAGCDRLLIVPLYPQYAAATSATVCDKAFETLVTLRRQPILRVAAPYYDEPVYIDALAATLRRALAALDFEPDVILGSFHGIPQSYVQKGDPYPRHCEVTWDLLRQAMGRDAKAFPMSYQSRFGPTKWLTPYTDMTVKRLARDGVKKIAIITPGFAADCLETLEEIGVENRGYFLENGGTHFAAIPCLNDSPEGIDMLADIVRRELAGWL